MTSQQFGTAERVSEAHIEHPTEQFGKEYVSDAIEKAHCIAFHWVHESRSVDEICLPFAISPVETTQHFRRHGQIGVENGQQRFRSVRKTEPHRVGFARARLLKSFYLEPVPIEFRDAFYFLPSSIRGVPLDKDDFDSAVQVGKSLEDILDIAALIAGRNYAAQTGIGRPDNGTQDDQVGKTQPSHAGQQLDQMI